MLMNTRLPRCLVAIISLAFTSLVGHSLVHAQDFEPGLVAHITLPDGSVVTRVDAMCDWKWDDAHEFDERLAPDGTCSMRWVGLLNVKTAGSYQLAISGDGRFQLSLDNKPTIQADRQGVQVATSPEQELTAGYHDIRIDYFGAKPSGQVQLYWRGPGFQWEPVSERYLVHYKAEEGKDDFERGRLIARGLRCAACHELPGSSSETILAAPDLTSLKGNLEPSWLVNRLTGADRTEPPHSQLSDDEISTRMPHFGLSTQDAADIVTALFNSSEKVHTFTLAHDYEAKSSKGKSKDKNPPRAEPKADEGRKIMLTRGCIACHSLEGRIRMRDTDDDAQLTFQARQDYLTYQLFAGPDLSVIGDKRPQDFFARWLAKPESINAAHRMPQAALSDLERDDLALYLSALHGRGQLAPFSDGNAQRGAELIAQHRCGNCHTLPRQLMTDAKKLPVKSESHWPVGCFGRGEAARFVPGFDLSAGQSQALKTYFTGRKASIEKGNINSRSNAELLMAESNCFACHARKTHSGLALRAMQVIDFDPDLAARLPAMLPPSLNGVGDKLHEAALATAIARKESPHRPWLDVRMPTYGFDETQVKSLVSAFVGSDRLPDFGDKAKSPLANDVVTRSAAARLVTSEGFGCQSCHQIGNQPSPTVALGARGTDLTMLGGRIRQSWYDRWVRNPIRIVPRMEMPAIQLPVHGVLNNDLGRQIDAVWEMLNTPGFQPPAPAPVRVVRKHNLTGKHEPAHVLTDVLETSDRNYLRPLIVGFENRHNVLLDLERGEIGKWWIGDTARELTRGKSWYWELGGQPLGAQLESLVRFELVDSAGESWKPQAIEQFAVDLDGLEHTRSGVKVTARMHFSKGEQKQTVPIEIEMEPEVKAWQESSVVKLVFQFIAPPDYQLKVLMADPTTKRLKSTMGPIAVLDEHTQIAVQGWSERHSRSDEIDVLIKAGSENEAISCELDLWTTWPVDQFVEAVAANTTGAQPPIAPSPDKPAQEVNVVPGFDGIQLPLPRNEMPTALAWHKGNLVIGSLKGRVCIARDSNNDGLEDAWEPISDDLPAPYGIASSGDSIDVLAKYGLVRLTPSKLADAPWKMQVVADGWGYTADYHDWAVGLVLDAQNNYVIALPCQQDDRTPSAARLRGTVQRLIPQTSTSQDPRKYRLETIAAGQRFPMGLAMDRAGRLFATDNQGNYNPFNELNHIQTGKRYGFINKLENKPGFSPPVESPAVNLPHPWTRSVNGICFLNTPAEHTNQNLFGPFEGHVIGCEYNGLSLIRMSLEEVDGVMQGAAYLFSMPALPGEPTFEGPVVCEVSPKGELVVGNIHDSGWGGGQNTGSIVRLKPTGKWRLGIAEVKALHDGLRIVFTGPVDSKVAGNASNYTIRSYRRISTPAYGGNDQEERQEPVLAAQVLDGNTVVDLTLNALRADSVYEIRVGKLAEETLFPDEAHYTMKKVPSK